MKNDDSFSMKWWLCVVLMAIVVSCFACAPKAQFLLLPNSDGTVGKIVVQNAGGTQVVDHANHATHVDDPAQAPSEPKLMSASEIQETFGDVLRIPVRPPDHFILYFQEGKAELTAESKALFPEILQTIRDRKAADISVVGHTDTKGSPEVNFRISKQRAEAVAAMLEAEGVDRTSLDITSHGERNLLVQTPDEVSEPRNRRVEVTVR
jgi:outer membrane protein OmpA-like peptidoglycan-associated protein